MAIYKNKRRSGFRDFLDGFTGTYNAMNGVFQDFETTDVMKEKPQEITSDQLTDEQYSEQQLATQGPVAPKQTRYDGKTYSGTLDDRKLTGLRMGRLADIAAKYGDAKGAMNLRKQVSDMEYEDRARARTEVGWQREDDDYRRRQQARDVMAEIDPTKPDSYVAASGKLTALGDAQGAADVMRQGGQQKEWMKARENEGVDRVDQLIRSNASPDEVMAAFNETGAMRLDGPPNITRTKDKTGREVIGISGTMDGKPFEVRDWDQWLTGRLTVDKRMEAAARTRDEGRTVDKIAEDGRRWDKGYALDERRTRAAEENARTSAENNRLLREQQIADKEAARIDAARKAAISASNDLDKYIEDNAVTFDSVDGKSVQNPEKQVAFREFANSYPLQIKGRDENGKEVLRTVRLSDVYQIDPRRAKALADQLANNFLVHQAVEKATGQKLPAYANLSYGEQTADDYSAIPFVNKKGLGLGSALVNMIPGANKQVIRYGDKVIDLSDTVNSEIGPRVQRALQGRREIERLSQEIGLPPGAAQGAAPSAPAKAEQAPPVGLRQAYSDPRSQSLVAANAALGEQIREAAKAGDQATVERLQKSFVANQAELDRINRGR